jgi:hypothetical protein
MAEVRRPLQRCCVRFAYDATENRFLEQFFFVRNCSLLIDAAG